MRYNPLRTVTITRDFASWRTAARRLLQQDCTPDSVLWQFDGAQPLLFSGREAAIASDTPGAQCPPEESCRGERAPAFTVPREFIDIARDVCLHRDPDRYSLLYRLLYRITHGQPNLLAIEVDDDVRLARQCHAQVGRDRHRMLGFVRFERLTDQQGELYFAWYRPDHYVLPTVAPEFTRRLRSMRWSVFTPDQSAHWDTIRLTYGPGVERRPETTDQVVGLWQTYYAATYNVQRDNPKAFRRFVPTRFLQNLPEAHADLPGPGRAAAGPRSAPSTS